MFSLLAFLPLAFLDVYCNHQSIEPMTTLSPHMQGLGGLHSALTRGWRGYRKSLWASSWKPPMTIAAHHIDRTHAWSQSELKDGLVENTSPKRVVKQKQRSWNADHFKQVQGTRVGVWVQRLVVRWHDSHDLSGTLLLVCLWYIALT